MPLTLYWLAVGAFCIGTATLVVAPLLPAIANELGVSISIAGQLVTVYALTYAIGSPIVSTLLGNRDRKLLLVAALAAFALASLLASAAQSFPELVAAQILLALAAGLFMPAANAVAVMLVAPERRGRAVSVVIGGLTVSVALGVPIGSLIGSFAGWRAAFVLVAVVGAISAIGLFSGVPGRLPRGTATLPERVAVARRPEVLLALIVTFLWATSVFSFYTFIAPFLTIAIGIDPSAMPLVLFMFGVAGWIGNMVGGRLADRRGPAPALAAALLILGLVYVGNALAAQAGPSTIAAAVTLIGLAIGGIAGWSFHPAQTSRLVSLAPDTAIVALSLNQSALYAGNAAGAALGALVVARGTLADLGWASAALQFAALAMLALALRSASLRVPHPQPGE